MHRSKTYRHLEVAELDVKVYGRPIRIATDGEVGPLGTRFRFSAQPAALSVYR
ncbi:hypothetical protein [Kibdelosporangium philippinense]|uniref:hypothetical protein n=1 Tax=Kibdelosporangium philippinense TaxID=211113 RepID=UPI00360A04A1